MRKTRLSMDKMNSKLYIYFFLSFLFFFYPVGNSPGNSQTKIQWMKLKKSRQTDNSYPCRHQSRFHWLLGVPLDTWTREIGQAGFSQGGWTSLQAASSRAPWRRGGPRRCSPPSTSSSSSPWSSSATPSSPPSSPPSRRAGKQS